ncbi:hypothetical protein XBO1_2510011 [Xenorhabdus bovienii str. oregonense]|uniref:Uncharacterized protein n=1 Tax=Xenorhabdus bovienii str. oregonense TaxID=1398202 RepID=A0A077NXT0_XENBV|nr:hypothetical protein XBO1_2510011 [Xenorhabdus bovienii str. oregonense]
MKLLKNEVGPWFHLLNYTASICSIMFTAAFIGIKSLNFIFGNS